MSRKTIPNTPTGISRLRNNKPATYRYQTAGGKTNYIGTAGRGRLQDRLREHLPGAKDYVPGTKIVVEQQPTIAAAHATEARAIKRSQPKYNKQGK